MLKKILMVLLILSVTLNIAFISTWVVHALSSHVRHVEPPADPNTENSIWCLLHRKLGVSEEQWRQIEPRLIAFRESSREICETNQKLGQEMIELLSAPEVDRTTIQAKQEEIIAGQRKMQNLVIKHLLAEKEVLTPQQQEQLFDLMQKNMACAGCGPMMGLGRGRGSGMGRMLQEGSIE